MKAEEVFEVVHDAGFRTIATDAHAANSLFDADLTAKIALVIGGEAQGISRIARQKADLMVHLPMPGHTESLNAGVTCSVMLYEALRRRLA
jgi:23S rRNA (guanosine2251-2'-O)-methyltransferase